MILFLFLVVFCCWFFAYPRNVCSVSRCVATTMPDRNKSQTRINAQPEHFTAITALIRQRVWRTRRNMMMWCDHCTHKKKELCYASSLMNTVNRLERSRKSLYKDLSAKSKSVFSSVSPIQHMLRKFRPQETLNPRHDFMRNSHEL